MVRFGIVFAEIILIHSVIYRLKIVYLCTVPTKLDTIVLHNCILDNNIYKDVPKCFELTILHKLKV